MDEQTFLEMEAKRRGISVTQLRMQLATPDSLMKDIVADSRRGISQSASMLPPTRSGEEVKRGTGWQDPAPLSTPGIDHVDRICQAQDLHDRHQRLAETVRVNLELAQIIREEDEATKQQAKEADPNNIWGRVDDE